MISTPVLYVGDNPGNASRIERLLREADTEQYDFETAGSVHAAIDCLADGCSSIVLLDLPPGDARLDALARISGVAPGAAIILLVGNDETLDAAEVVRLGVEDVLTGDVLTGPTLTRTLELALARARTRQELRSSEQRYRSLFDNVPVSITRSLPDGTFLDVNDAAVRLLAYPDKQTLLAKRSIDLYVSPALHDQIDAQLVQHGIVREVAVELRRYDGTTIWVEGSIRAVYDEDGKIAHVESAMRDVTVRRRAFETVNSLARFPSENPNIVLRLAASGTVLYANPAGIAFLESTEPAGAIPEKWHATIAQVLQSEAPAQLTGSYGEDIFQFTFAPVRPDNYVNVYATDVTSLKGMENALRGSEQQLKAVFDNAQEAILLLDDDGSYVAANPAASRLLGYEHGRLVGLKPWDVIANPDVERSMREWEHLKQIGEYYGDYTIHRKDGVSVDVEVQTVANIAPNLHLTILRDVTERRRAVEALRDSEQKFRSVIEQSADGIFLIDDGRVLEWNPELEKITGLPRDEVLGKNAWDIHYQLMPPERRERFTPETLKTAILTMFEEARAGDKLEWLWEYEILRANGEHRTVQNAMFITQPAPHLRIGAVLRDVTELKRAETAEREQRAIAEALQESTAVLNSTLDLDEVLRLILLSAGRVVPSDGSILVTIEDGIGQISQCQGYYLDEGLDEDLLITSEPIDTFTNWKQMADTGQPVVIDDVNDYPGWDPRPGMEHVRAYMGAPIIHQGELLGFINLTSKSAAAFTEKHAQHLKAFSDQAAIAIRNAKLYEAEQHRRRVAETLRRASAVFSSTLALNEVLDRIMEQLGEVLPYDSASVQQMEGGRLIIRGARGFDDSKGLLGQSFPITPRFPNKRVIDTKQPLVLADAVVEYPAFYEDSGRYQSSRIRTWMGVPLIASDQVIGVITLDRNEVNPYTEEEVKLAVAFANHAATALENARLYAELENYSSILVQAIHEATGELRQTLEQLQAILDNSPDTILLLAKNGAIESGNPAFERLFGYSQAEIIGQQASHLLDDADTSAFHRALRAVREQHVTRRLEVTARRENGSTFDAEIALAPILEDERLLGIVCSLRDISAFKEVERMKDALVSTAAHELRTPLTTIQGFSELLLDRNLSEQRTKRYLHFINIQSEQLATIINDLLDISRLESGHGLNLTPQPIAIAPIVREAAAPFIETNSRHAFELIGLDNAPQVYGDPIRLGQVVKNLVSNAVKYSPDGGPVIIRVEADDGHLHVSVQDEGIGINDEQLPRIFEKFYRADSSNTAVSGTGLGLTICKLIVEGHGGSIEVESAYGQGSTFTFHIPIFEAEPAAAPA